MVRLLAEPFSVPGEFNPLEVAQDVVHVYEDEEVNGRFVIVKLEPPTIVPVIP